MAQWKVYLDACCLNRPFDDQTQDRIRIETEAILLIMTHFAAREWEWIGSEALEFEIHQMPDAERRFRVQSLLNEVHRSVQIQQTEAVRGKHLETLGFKPFDALHIACAESSHADVFLTTDDKFLRRAKRLKKQLTIRVENPLTWFQEVT
ncbi:PIN domain-containing protein [Candidatus Poribacteria bacterium]|nr:PIN domain-containing protein [Candidatus Poribacteria bacterium]